MSNSSFSFIILTYSSGQSLCTELVQGLVGKSTCNCTGVYCVYFQRCWTAIDGRWC